MELIHFRQVILRNCFGKENKNPWYRPVEQKVTGQNQWKSLYRRSLSAPYAERRRIRPCLGRIGEIFKIQHEYRDKGYFTAILTKEFSAVYNPQRHIHLIVWRKREGEQDPRFGYQDGSEVGCLHPYFDLLGRCKGCFLSQRQLEGVIDWEPPEVIRNLLRPALPKSKVVVSEQLSLISIPTLEDLIKKWFGDFTSFPCTY